MSGIGGCRSSGAITADKLVFTGRGKLISIYADVTHLGGTTGAIFTVEFS